ncbi:MAG: cardiolipin synthase [Clostridia bacterium]|nr:cardiolipin synthase [Clostridia bacterium]MDD4047315.1 cardiolipin synthase [Clostridia bacterium]
MRTKLFFPILIIVLLLINLFTFGVIDVESIKSLYFSSHEIFLKIAENIIYFIFVSLLIFTDIIIILERRDPAKTLAWLLILIFLPVLGFILYLIFGRQIKKRKVSSKKKFLNNSMYPLDNSFLQYRKNPLTNIANSKKRLIQLILNNANFPPTIYNEISILNNGEEIFPAFIEALKAATKYIYLETYILRDDVIGNTITKILCLKAQEGIKVHLIYDGLGSLELKKSFLKKLKLAGIKVEPFFPVRLSFLHRKINYRNHRKILVVDGTIGFVGGANIGDEYLGINPKFGFWRETHLLLKGNAVYFLQRIFLQDWYFTTKKCLQCELPTPFSEINSHNNEIVQITASGPDTYWESIMQVYYYAIATAEKSIYITSPYFIPNESILTALKTAALSGVDVKLLLPAKPDHKIVFWASMSYLEELLEAGVNIFLYNKGFLHSKVLTIDGVVSSIGSANMDQRSFNLNFEVNALIYDKATAKKLEENFLNDLKTANMIELEKFSARPLNKRFIESIAKLLSPIL